MWQTVQYRLFKNCPFITLKRFNLKCSSLNFMLVVQCFNTISINSTVQYNKTILMDNTVSLNHFK